MRLKMATRRSAAAVAYRSPLHQMTLTTPTMLWNDSADLDELRYAIDNGAVGATCNPVIALGILKKESSTWTRRAQALAREMPAATEDQIGWKLVEEVSVRAAKLLEPAFAEHGGRNGRLSIQTDARLYRRHRTGDLPRHHHQRDGLFHDAAVHRCGRGSRARPEPARSRGSRHRVDGTRLHDHGGPPGRLAQGVPRPARHLGGPGHPRVGRRGRLQEDLPPLPRSRLSRAAARRGVSQPHALEPAHRRGRRGVSALRVAAAIQRE